MAAVPLATLVTRVRRWLQDEPWQTTLSTASINAAATTIDVPDGTMWAEGDRGEFADGDVFRVTSVATNALTVKRGHNGSTAASHTSGDIILKNPEYEYNAIADAISFVATTLWPWCWDVNSTTITPVSGDYFYALPSDFLELVKLYQLSGSDIAAKTAWVEYGVKGSGRPVKIHRNMPTASFASGMAIEVTPHNTTNNLNLVYAAHFTSSTVEEGHVADAVVLGAVARLLEMEEVERTTQDVEHGDIGINAGAKARDAAYFQGRFEQARHVANLHLKRTSPLAGRW